MFSNGTSITLYNNQGDSSDYKVISLLGQGKFQVFKVSDSKGAIFALKVFPKDCQQFQDEARFQFLSHESLASPLMSGTGEYSVFKSEFEVELSEFSFILTKFCPNGTLYDMLVELEFRPDEKTTKSLFLQVLKALDYLHKNNVAHADLKLENIFIDENFKLKVADFDLSFKEGDKQLSRGTPNYRALEVRNVEFYDPYRSDIYSLAIVLFVLQNGRQMPFFEDFPQSMVDFYNFNKKYWVEMKKMMQIEESEEIWSDDFKELFIGMTKYTPSERLTIDEIQKSKWLSGEIYDEEELKTVMREGFENARKNKIQN